MQGFFLSGNIRCLAPDGPHQGTWSDGFPARFFQRHWEVLRDDVVRAVHMFFSEGVMPPGINGTAIVLITKGNNPTELKDFYPIRLCNVIYKVMSKCMVNRLRPLFGDLVSKEQSAFVLGRMITDNALIAFECIHAIQRGSGDQEEFCAYKLDLSKPYDRVDWGFFTKSIVEAGLSKSMGAVSHGVCDYCSLLNSLQ